MKINQKILSIPPYISTSWKNVLSLHIEDKIEGKVLMIGLVNGATIEIPDLDPAVIEATFASHQKFLEQESSSQMGASPLSGPLLPPEIIREASATLSLPIRLGMDPNMGNLLQHNPESADSPDLPKEVIEKIAGLSKAVGLEGMNNFPKPEPHCNCMHCQIMRAIQGQVSEEEKPSIEDEPITEEDLRFREWDIQQKGDQLYLVTNPLNTAEHYDVFLGNPVGCTCGNPNCEHLKAVLSS